MVNELGIRVLVALQALKAKFDEERGQTLAEYGLILAVIAVAVVVLAGIAFREAIVGAFSDATDCLSGATTGCERS